MRWRGTGGSSLSPDNLPETIQQAVETRLERLPEPKILSQGGSHPAEEETGAKESVGEVAEVSKSRPGAEGELPISPH